jgi:hypothetical protein
VLTYTATFTTAIGAAAAEAWEPSAKQSVVRHYASGLTFAYKLTIGGCCCRSNCVKQVREFSQTHPIPSDRPV